MKTHNTLFILLVSVFFTACGDDKPAVVNDPEPHQNVEVNDTTKLQQVDIVDAKEHLITSTGESLDLEFATVTVDDAQGLVDDGPTFITFETGGEFRSVPSPVNTAYIDKNDWLSLNTRAATLHAANGNPCGTPTIAAVRITMAVDLTVATAPRTKLFFEPLYLCRTTNDPGDEDTYKRNNNAVGGIFEFNGTDFVPSAFGSYVTNYTTSIKINCYASPYYRNFIDSDEGDGDTRSAIYPIQEFVDLIDHNENTQGIYILNTGYRTGSIFNRYTRHGLLFCPNNFTFMEQFDLEEEFNEKTAIGTFTGKLADKGGLCPPNCDEVFYKRK